MDVPAVIGDFGGVAVAAGAIDFDHFRVGKFAVNLDSDSLLFGWGMSPDSGAIAVRFSGPQRGFFSLFYRDMGLASSRRKLDLLVAISRCFTGASIVGFSQIWRQAKRPERPISAFVGILFCRPAAD